MQKSNAPTPFTVAFANGAGSGYRNVIPIPSQISITPGAASYTDGFPPITMEPAGSGGIPPYGADMNGVLYASTLATLWEQAGFMQAFSSTLSTAYGGYPAQSVLAMGSGLGLWLNTADNNTTSPDTTGSLGWIAVLGNAGKTVMNVTGGTYTPDPSVLGVKLLYLQGTLTSNLTLVLPLTAGAAWKIYNNTSGSFTVTAGGTTGASVTIPGANLVEVSTDGTNFYTASVAGGPYLPLTGTAVAASKLATARSIAMTGDVAWSVNFDGSANVTAAGTIQPSSVTLAKMANFTANSLMGNPTGSAIAPQAITLGSLLAFNSSGSSINLAAISPTTLLGNWTGSAAVPQAIGLANGLQFSGATLGMGSITPVAVTTGVVIATNQIEVLPISGRATIVMTAGTSTGAPTKYIEEDGTNLVIINSAGAASIFTLTDGGALTVPGTITFGQDLFSTTSTALLSTNGAGQCLLWPNGPSSGAGQFVVSSSGQATVNGNLVVTGTINGNTSDATLKQLSSAEPRALWRVPWYAYKRTDTGEHSYGPTAQGMAELAPDYVHEYEHTFTDGKSATKLAYQKDQVALESIFCAGRLIDQLLDRVAALEAKV